ncbi:hypothetical protein GZL_01020 [Streptomyces sp. 769]|nr:hypothetical protein GZL_01020 [Streptomyces sp. 769]
MAVTVPGVTALRQSWVADGCGVIRSFMRLLLFPWAVLFSERAVRTLRIQRHGDFAPTRKTQ